MITDLGVGREGYMRELNSTLTGKLDFEVTFWVKWGQVCFWLWEGMILSKASAKIL